MKTISIVMAVYNERDSLPTVLKKIRDLETGLKKEIIIVDGCSTDGTKDILQGIKDRDIKVIFEEKKSGKGAALQLGFRAATGDIILIQDGDLEIEPFEYPALLKPLMENSCDIVYGSRFMNGKGRTKIVSYLGNKAMTLTANILFNARLTDIETCCKIFRRDIIKDMKFTCSGFDFDAELTALFLKSGRHIVEMPIDYKPRNKQEGKKLHWLSGVTSLSAIWRCWFSR